MKKQQITISVVVGLIIILAIVGKVFIGGSSSVKLVITPDGDEFVIASVVGNIKNATHFSMELQTPEGYSFNSIVDLEDSNKVLRAGNVRSNAFFFEAVCESGLPKVIGAIRYSVLSATSEPDFQMVEIDCRDSGGEKIPVKIEVEK